MGAITPSYEVSAATSVAGGSNIWIILRHYSPGTAWDFTSPTWLEVYVQASQPVSTDTPVFQGGGLAFTKLDSLSLWCRGGGTATIGALEYRIVDPNLLGWTVTLEAPAVTSPSDALASVPAAEWSSSTSEPTAMVYLGTNKAYQAKEVT